MIDDKRGPMAIRSSVRSPRCQPAYVNQECGLRTAKKCADDPQIRKRELKRADAKTSPFGFGNPTELTKSDWDV